MESYLDRKEKPYSKYINWPSCDSTDWMWRYWGQNYNRLLNIKAISPRCCYNQCSKLSTKYCEIFADSCTVQAYWDPENVFRHCQSVGSQDNDCCPFTLARPQGPPPRP